MKDWLSIHPIRLLTILFAVGFVVIDFVVMIRDRRRLRRMARKLSRNDEPEKRKGGDA